MIGIGIITILWGVVGGFDWIFDTCDCITMDYYSVLNELKSNNHDYQEIIKHQNNILSMNEKEINNYKQFLDSKLNYIYRLESEMENLKDFLNLQQDRLDSANNILKILENLEKSNEDTII